jgi:hypothetical protein
MMLFFQHLDTPRRVVSKPLDRLLYFIDNYLMPGQTPALVLARLQQERLNWLETGFYFTETT